MEQVPYEIMKAREALKAKYASTGRVGKAMGRRTKKVVHKNSDLAENKLRVNLRKVGCTPMDGIQEVNFFPTNDELYHFEKCEVLISPNANVTAVFGEPERAPLTKYLPGIMNQFGLGSLINNPNLMKAAEAKPEDAEEEEDVPELVENFDEVNENQ